MQIENHVPSLETCKRMKELGWSKHTILFLREGGVDYERTMDETIASHDLYTPILSELLEVLPERAAHNRHFYSLTVQKNESGQTVVYYSDDSLGMKFLQVNGNPAEAAALLWIKLVEEGIISSNEKE